MKNSFIFHQANSQIRSRPLTRGSAIMGIASRLMDKRTMSSRMLDREIMRITRAHEEQEKREKKEQNQLEEEQKRKVRKSNQSTILRQIDIFGSYRRASLMSASKLQPVIEVSDQQTEKGRCVPTKRSVSRKILLKVLSVRTEAAGRALCI